MVLVKLYLSFGDGKLPGERAFLLLLDPGLEGLVQECERRSKRQKSKHGKSPFRPYHPILHYFPCSVHLFRRISPLLFMFSRIFTYNTAIV